ncbi:MAG: ATP synthase F1 subunit gamma [Thermoleophilia bacterium]|nr:MAG: ATP synthase F1 subunit gamma [Thermoleophilia bacterium]
MASLQDIRRRIHSVKNTSKITKAMELVAGAKLRRAQVRIESLRPFADGMHELITETAGRTQALRNQPLLERRELTTTAILVMTGDRGLAGAFNASVLRRALDEAKLERAAGHQVVWYAAGRKGAGSLRFRGAELRHVWTGFTDRPVYQDAEQIANTLVEDYTEQIFDRLVMVFNHFDSPLMQTVNALEVLPIPLPERLTEMTPRERAMMGELLFEPEAEEILTPLLTTALETEIFRALLESTASEHGARMTAMRNASDNAKDLIDRITLDMNRARQSEITQQLLEVVAGADALS